MANLLLIRDLCEINKIKIRELASRIGKDESTIQSMIRAGSTNTKTCISRSFSSRSFFK